MTCRRDNSRGSGELLYRSRRAVEERRARSPLVHSDGWDRGMCAFLSRVIDPERIGAALEWRSVEPATFAPDWLPHLFIVELDRRGLAGRWRLAGGHVEDVLRADLHGKAFSTVFTGPRLVQTCSFFERVAKIGRPVVSRTELLDGKSVVQIFDRAAVPAVDWEHHRSLILGYIAAPEDPGPPPFRSSGRVVLERDRVITVLGHGPQANG